MAKQVTETDSANRYHSFRKGWSDGSRGDVPRPEFDGHADAGIAKAYRDGHVRGLVDRARCMQRASKLYRFTPTVLR